MAIVPQKGIDPQALAVQYFMQRIGELGYKSVTITCKSDQEPAVRSVIDSVVAAQSAPTLLEESPAGSSQRNGAIESAVGESEAQIRVARLALEHNYAHKILINHIIVPWLVKHCSFSVVRFLNKS